MSVDSERGGKTGMDEMKWRERDDDDTMVMKARCDMTLRYPYKQALMVFSPVVYLYLELDEYENEII